LKHGFSALILLHAIALSAVQPVQAAGYVPGLALGQSATFSVSGPLSEGVVRTEMQVVRIEGANLTVSFTDYFENEAGPTDSFWIDLATGSGNSGAFRFAIGANLSLGDPLYQNSQATILRTEVVPCGSGDRSTNYAEIAGEVPGQIVVAHWDRTTGIMCNLRKTNQDGQYFYHNMTATSLWSPGTPETPQTPSDDTLRLLIVGLVGTGALSVASALFFGKRRRKARKLSLHR